MSGRQRAKWASSPGNKRTKTKRHEHQKKQTRMPRGCGCSDTGHARCDGVLWGAPRVAPVPEPRRAPGARPMAASDHRNPRPQGLQVAVGSSASPVPIAKPDPSGPPVKRTTRRSLDRQPVLRGKPGDSGPRALRRGSRRHRPLQRRRVLGHPEATPSSSWLPPPCSLSGPNAASSGLGDAAFDPHPGSWRPLPSP